MARDCPNGGGGGNTTGNNYGGEGAVKLSDHVNDGNRTRALVCRGVPYRATHDEILEFFNGHGSLKEENLTIEEMNGRRTGSCLVVFENSEQAQGAKQALQKQEIGGRYIDIFDENDSFMQRICRL